MKKTFTALARRSDYRGIAGGLRHRCLRPAAWRRCSRRRRRCRRRRAPRQRNRQFPAGLCGARAGLRGARAPASSTSRCGPIVIRPGSCGRCASPADGQLKPDGGSKSRPKLIFAIMAGSHEPAICICGRGTKSHHELRLPSTYLFDRMILSEKSVTFRDHALDQFLAALRCMSSSTAAVGQQSTLSRFAF